MTKIKTYVCLVDICSPRPHRTKGRYYVGAKNEKEAKKLLQKVIKFGSIQVYCESHPNFDPILEYKEVKKAVWNEEKQKFQAEEIINPY